MAAPPKVFDNALPTDVTIDAPLSGDTNGGRPPSLADDREFFGIALVQGSGLGLSDETQDLLRCRLRSASLVLAIGFGVFLFWQFFRTEANWHNVWELGVFIAQASVTMILGVFGASLCRSCTIDITTLRLKELVIFGLPAAFFLLVDYVRIPHTAVKEDFLIFPSPGWTLLIFTYALFIPNSWQRAALVIGAMAAAPVIMVMALREAFPSIYEAENASPDYLIELLLQMGISSIISIVGVAMINGLRYEAFAAKQLGQYRLRKLIGSGGMGDVYLAEHAMMKRPCAIKVIRPEKAGDPKVLARFEREVRSAAQLSHWNTIEIYDYGRTAEGTFYYVMEFLPGLSLQELVERHGPLPAERLVYLLRQVCDGLGEAHEKGLVHRDIKPANIFAAQRGGQYDVAKLLDFGLVKPIAENDEAHLTQDGTITGSPLFISPEQATGDAEPDARSDIYSLGATAYFLLTGRPPFVDEKAIKVLMAHAYELPHPLTKFEAGVPADIEQMVLKCLAKKPSDRYQSVAELAADLDQCTVSGHWSGNQAAGWGKSNLNEESMEETVQHAAA